MNCGVDLARRTLAVDHAGRPLCRDTEQLYRALRELERHRVSDHDFLVGAAERYETWVAPTMRQIPGATFQMGTPAGQARHYCGETPAHTVRLSPFALSAVAVTTELYGKFDPHRLDVPTHELRWPVVGVTWFDCAVFARWMGCVLPSEAQWEYACGTGGSGQWCCAPDELPNHAWYSENADEHRHAVAAKEPNRFGLFDMPGNVWEWCQDSYAPNFYARAPKTDPVNDSFPDKSPGWDPDGIHKASRGGGYLALAEMCRTRYRAHDPAAYWATDLGFRLADRLRAKG